MSDLLVPAPSIPSIRLKTLLPTNRHDAKAASLRTSKSTTHLRTNSKGGPISRTVRGVNDYWLSWRDGLTPQQRDERRQSEERRQILSLRMRNADAHEQWEAAAKELDHLEGNNEWKQDDTTPNDWYNPDLIAERLQGLDAARESCDIHQMMHLIRTSLSRDLGGMDSVDLYRHSYIGTKGLIERYVDSTLATIDTIVSQSSFDTSVEHRDLLEGMLFARQSFGRSALLLSGGGTFGMAHVGVLKSLFESKLLPRIISGASAGSIVSAVMCTKTDEEMPTILQEFPYGNLSVFEGEENQDGVLGHLRRLLTEGSWSDIKHLTTVMREIAGDLTFQEAYNRTRRILNICVSTASIYELPRLLNYVTAPNVMIWSAVAASCSVPLVFNASPLLVKDPVTGEHSPWNPTPQHWIDGSVDNDLPMTRLAEMFNVNHFIVSQVNPHVVPFLSKDDFLSPEATERPKASSQDDVDWVYTLTTLAKEEAMHRLQFLAEIGIFPNLATKFRSILSQRYSGDITILPEMTLHDLRRLLANPTSDFMLRSCLAGERATWPKLSRVRDRCAIELALDRAVHRLRARVVFSEGHSDLRNQHFSVSNLKIHGQRSGSSPESKSQPRQRRQSGGSLLSMGNRRALLDDEQSKDTHAKNSSQTTSPPFLKRASKSHVQVSQHFRRPSTAPTDIAVHANAHPSPTTVRKAWLDPWPTSKPASGIYITPTHDDADTSELGPSDEPRTDESEADTWDDQSRTSPDTEAFQRGVGDALKSGEIDVSDGLST